MTITALQSEQVVTDIIRSRSMDSIRPNGVFTTGHEVMRTNLDFPKLSRTQDFVFVVGQNFCHASLAIFIDQEDARQFANDYPEPTHIVQCALVWYYGSWHKVSPQAVR